MLSRMSLSDSSRLGRFVSWTWRVRHRTSNALRDWRDRWLRGYCCAMSHDGEDEAGVYYFWRCGLKRGHKGPHRSCNYLWGHEGTMYSPLSPAPPMLNRHATMTRRQRQARERWHEAHEIARKP